MFLIASANVFCTTNIVIPTLKAQDVYYSGHLYAYTYKRVTIVKFRPQKVLHLLIDVGAIEDFTNVHLLVKLDDVCGVVMRPSVCIHKLDNAEAPLR